MPIKSATKAKPALRLPAKALGFTETQASRLALARLGQETLPRYEPDGGPLTVEQLKAIIKTIMPQGRMETHESLFS